MEIISEAVGLEYDAAQEPQEPQEPLQEPQAPLQEPPSKRRAHRATSKAAPKARVRAPEPAPPEPEPPVEPSPAPKAKARPTVRAAPAPAAPAPAGIGDVLNMLASALLDQRQARASRRQEMYSRFLD